MQAIIHDDLPGQGTITGIDRRHVASRRYGFSGAINCRATCTVGGDTGTGRSDQQCRAQDEGDQADEQKNRLVLHGNSSLFLPNDSGR